MPPPLLIDLDRVDPAQVVLTKAQIYEYLPQCFEFQVLDGICMVDKERLEVAAYAEVRTDDWWVRGHLPGRPLLPGVVMLEMAGQVSAMAASLCGDVDGFVGFGGVRDCRFRESVAPPARLTLLCLGIQLKRRRIISKTQGIIDGRIVFEAEIIGVTMRE